MLYAIATLTILILDQSVKYWTVSNIELLSGVRPFIPKIVQLVYVRNYGAAFSLFQNGRWAFLILAAAFAGLVIYALARGIIRGGFGRWMAVFALAGAMGNAIDRALYGYVVDMFDLLFMNFPVFNVADTFINIGAIGFCIYVLLSKNPFVEKGASDEGEPLPVTVHESPLAPKAPNKLTLREKLSALSAARKAEKQAREISASPVGIETITKESLKARFTPKDPSRPFAEWEKDIPSPISVQEIRTQPKTPPIPEVPNAQEAPVDIQRMMQERIQDEPVQIQVPDPEALSDLMPDFSILKELDVDLSDVEDPDAEDEYNLDDIIAEFTDR